MTTIQRVISKKSFKDVYSVATAWGTEAARFDFLSDAISTAVFSWGNRWIFIYTISEYFEILAHFIDFFSFCVTHWKFKNHSKIEILL